MSPYCLNHKTVHRWRHRLPLVLLVFVEVFVGNCWYAGITEDTPAEVFYDTGERRQ